MASAGSVRVRARVAGRAAATGASSATTERVERHRPERPLRRLRLEPRHREQLLHQPRRALHAFLELRERRGTLRIVPSALGELDLQREGGERGAQLVRGVGSEAALHRERLAQPREEPVQCVDERPHLTGQACGRERVEGAGVARAHRPRHARERRQAAVEDQPHETGEQRQHSDDRHEQPQRRRGCKLGAEGGRLRDLDGLRAGNHGVHAPLAPLVRDRREAGLTREGQGRVRVREVDGDPAGTPDLDDDALRGVPVGAPEPAHVEHRVIAQRQRDLAHFLVEQRADLGARVVVGRGAGDHPGGKHRAEQRGKQAAAERGHSAGTV
jgi:hypothetical protein